MFDLRLGLDLGEELRTRLNLLAESSSVVQHKITIVKNRTTFKDTPAFRHLHTLHAIQCLPVKLPL